MYKKNEEKIKGAEAMKEYLDGCPKVAFLIPLSEGEQKGAYDTVCLNGYLMKIEKGVMMDLPKPVVEILANKYNVEMETAERMASGTIHTKEEIEKTLG